MIYFEKEPIDKEDTTNSRAIIQSATKFRHVTMTDMRERYNDGKPENEQCSAQNLNGKMKRDSFTFTELVELLDGIGFDVVIRARDEESTPTKANQGNKKKDYESHSEEWIASPKKTDVQEDMPTPAAFLYNSELLPPITETASGAAEVFRTRDNREIVAPKGGSRRSYVPVTGLSGEKYYISGVYALQAARALDTWFLAFQKSGIPAPDEGEIESFLFDVMGAYDVRIGVEEAAPTKMITPADDEEE